MSDLNYTLPEPSERNTRFTMHDDPNEYRKSFGVVFNADGRKFRESIDLDAIDIYNRRVIGDFKDTLISKLKASIAAHLAVVNPIDNSDPVQLTPRDFIKPSSRPHPAQIDSIHYFTAKQGVVGRFVAQGTPRQSVPEAFDRLTFCILTLKNGLTVAGASTRGERYAHDNAVNQILSLSPVPQPLGVFP